MTEEGRTRDGRREMQAIVVSQAKRRPGKATEV